MVGAVDEEDDPVDFGEVVAPETTCCGVVLGGENGMGAVCMCTSVPGL